MAFPWLAQSAEESDGGPKLVVTRGSSVPHSPATDAELVGRIRDGDGAAMDALFTAYYIELRSFAMSYLHAREAAEDVVQDVFVRVWERRAEWTVHGSVAQYLYGAVRNRALNVVAHDRIVARDAERVAREQEREPTTATNAGPMQVEAREVAAIVERVIASLPPRCREVFLLSRSQRLSQRELAATLGITVNTVNVQLGRALRALDAALRDRG